MTFILFVTLVALGIWISNLQSRITHLEERLPKPTQPTTATSESVATPSPATTPTTNTPATPAWTAPHTPMQPLSPTAVPPAANASTPPPTTPATRRPTTVMTPTPAEPSPFITWWQENTLIKIGAILFFLGAVWFVSYAVSQGWISPTLRIFFGIALGLCVYVIAHVTRHQRERYLTLTALGSGIIFASIFAGQFVFNLFLPSLALIFLVLTVIYTVYVSLKTETEWLSVTAVIAAMLAPQLINEPNPSAFLLYLYLLTIATSFMLVLVRTNWRSLTLTLSLGFIFYQLQIHGGQALPETTHWLLILASSALLYAAGTFLQLRSRRVVPLDVTILGINILTATLWSIALVDPSELAIFALAGFTATLGYVVYLSTRQSDLAFTHSAFTLMLIIIGTQLTFSDAVLTMVYTLEATAVLFAALYLNFKPKVVHISAFLFLLPVISSLGDILTFTDSKAILGPAAIALYTLTLAQLVIASFTVQLRTSNGNRSFPVIASWFAVGTYLYAVISTALVWNGVFPNAESIAALGDLKLVATYATWTVITYLAVSWSIGLRLSGLWVTVSAASIFVPVTISLTSFLSDAWDSSALHPHALGLYFMTASLAFIATLLYRTNYCKEETSPLQQILGLGAGLYLFCLVWQIAHALIPTEDYAVTVSLVVYTISGLVCYLQSKTHQLQTLRYVGIALLGSVILRLGLVDIWEMEVLWRIIAFFGIGGMFMAAAFFEKPFTHNESSPVTDEGPAEN